MIRDDFSATGLCAAIAALVLAPLAGCDRPDAAEKAAWQARKRAENYQPSGEDLAEHQRTQGCFDTVVVARALRRDTVPGGVRIRIERVLYGRAELGEALVLMMGQQPQFTSRTWWLRRNTSGTFNVIGHAHLAGLHQCPEGQEPAETLRFEVMI